jgi:hypothetical protein
MRTSMLDHGSRRSVAGYVIGRLDSSDLESSLWLFERYADGNLSQLVGGDPNLLTILGHRAAISNDVPLTLVCDWFSVDIAPLQLQMNWQANAEVRIPTAEEMGAVPMPDLQGWYFLP